jgi:VCBS repeat-containing protein
VSGHRHFTPDVQATGFEAKPAAGSALVVGQIESVVGVCSLTRPGGDPFQVKRGDPICRGDILETTAGGKVGIRFIDGTAFNLSDSARAVVKEFGCDGAEPSALFDISRGTFAFIAGEVAKLGRLGIETPFASIRGRAQSGGIGMLSLASLFFAALDNAHGTTTPPGLEDGIINIRDSNDIINAPFGIIELTVGSQTIFIDTPFAEFVVRGTSVSQVPLSLTQLQQYIIESINVQNIAWAGQPTVGGPSGSGGLPPPGPPPFVEPINFVPPPVPPSGGPTGGTNSSGTGVDIFIPPPPPQPPLGPGEIREIINVTNSGTIDSTSGPLPVAGLFEPTLFIWSGGNLTNDQINAIKQQGIFTPNGSTYTYTIPDHVLDFVAANETLKITYTSTTDPTQSVTITIFGTEDIPVITSGAQSGSASEIADNAIGENTDIHHQSGTVTFLDVDLSDSETGSVTSRQVTNATLANSYTLTAAQQNALLNAFTIDPATHSQANGTGTVGWHYDISDLALDFLGDNDQLTLTFTVQVNDGHGGLASQNVTITIFGTEDGPTITSATVSGTVTEDSLPTTASGTINFADVDLSDAHSVSVTGNGTQGYLGTLSASVTNDSTTDATGQVTWNFTVDNADLQFLDEGQTLTQTYSVIVDDGHGGTAPQTVTITLVGKADPDPNDFDDQATGTEVVTIGNIVHGTALGDPTIAGGGNTGQTIYGGGGNDHINGTGQNDIIFGGSGNDDINGNGGDDLIYGGSGNDTINGSNDNDIIIGGFGADSLSGGGGDDAFHYLSPLDSNAAHFDTITDFLHGNDDDLIDLTAFGLAPTSGHEFHTNGTAAGVQNTDSANFFSISGTTYAVVSTQVGSDTYVYADLNQNGNFDTSGDLVIKLSGFTQTNLSSNDFLFTNSPANLINSVNGGEILAGTVGNDTFVFNAIANSQPGAGNFDTIINFMHNSDHIDLQAINGANLVQGQVNTATTVDAHSISWFLDTATNETIIYVNTTDTANHVDMEIHLTGTNINLSGSDILHT